MDKRATSYALKSSEIVHAHDERNCKELQRIDFSMETKH